MCVSSLDFKGHRSPWIHTYPIDRCEEVNKRIRFIFIHWSNEIIILIGWSWGLRWHQGITWRWQIQVQIKTQVIGISLSFNTRRSPLNWKDLETQKNCFDSIFNRDFEEKKNCDITAKLALLKFEIRKKSEITAELSFRNSKKRLSKYQLKCTEVD